MNQYIKSEIYRILRNKWTYLFIVICSGLLLSSNIILAVVKSTDGRFPYATTNFAFTTFSSSMSSVYLLCISVACMLFGNEYTNHTFKNSISFGISRGTMYIGKFLVQIIYSVVAFTIIAAVYIGSGYILLENSGIDALKILLNTSFACLPLFLFSLAVANCFLFLIDAWSSIAAMIGLMIVLPMVTNLLGMRFQIFNEFSKLIPWNLINKIHFNFQTGTMQLMWAGAEGYRNYWLIGIIEMLLITVIGYVLFNKKEIK